MMNILFICTHNRCRSILAQAITRQISKEKVNVQSAGSAPARRVHKLTLEHLHRHGYETKDLHSKSWDDLGDFEPDVCITVCDNAAQEACPVWLGDALKIHWGLSDPSSDNLAEEQRQTAFDTVIDILEKRRNRLCQYDFKGMNDEKLKNIFKEIGEIT